MLWISKNFLKVKKKRYFSMKRNAFMKTKKMMKEVRNSLKLHRKMRNRLKKLVKRY